MSKRKRYVVMSLVVVLVTSATSLVVLRHKPGFAEITELRQARESGKPVEIVGQRTDVQTTWANPNGTFTRNYSAVPKWVKTADGWKKIDFSLVKGKKGALRPKAAPDNVVLSGGEDKALLSMTTGGVKTSMSWPTTLPRPIVDNATATYANVFPGVDLKMTVTAAGPSQVLVVKNAKAAANPALDRLRLSTTVEGGSMGEDAGGLRVLDPRGREVARAPQPQMWDSGGGVIDTASRPVAGARAVQERLAGPARGDRVGAVKLSVVKESVVLAPDARVLRGGGVTYPVFIDPQLAPPKFDWAMVRQQSPSTVYYKWTNSAQGVGYDGGYKQRLFWKFEVADLAGADITKATFTAEALGTVNCSTHLVSLQRTNQITPSTNWSNQPSTIGSELDERNAATGASCDPQVKPLEFAAGDAAQAAANANIGLGSGDPPVKLTLRLIADAETSSSSWAWFDKDATLSIVYTFAPGTPTSLSLADPAATCGTVTSQAAKIGGIKPRVSALLTDLDKDNVRVQFQAFEGGTIESGETPFWSEDVGGSSGAGAMTSISGNYFVSATRIQKSDGTLDFNDHYYVWRARAVKANDSSNFGPWSAPCVFKLSTSVVPKPGVAPTVPGVAWQVDDPVGVKFSPTEVAGAPVPTNVAYYRWSLNTATASNLASIPAGQADKQVVVPVTTSRAGFNELRVWSYDLHGNRSLPQVYTFDTSAGAGVFGARYLLDEGTGSVVSNDAVGTRHLTVPSTAWDQRGTYRKSETLPTATDNLLHLAGTEPSPPASASTAVDTTKAFTVSAWVDPEAGPSNMTAVSQGTATQSAFVLGIGTGCPQMDPASQCYRFGLLNSTGSYVYVTSQRAVIEDNLPPKPTLVHLVATISTSGKARLYVFADGLIDKSSATLPAPATTSTGPLVLGAERAASAYTNKWVGNIDTVTVMPGALDSPGAVQLHALDNERCYVTRYDQGLTSCAE